MMVAVTEQRLAALRDAILRAVKTADDIEETWMGPRSSELGFVTYDGVEVTLSIQARERQG